MIRGCVVPRFVWTLLVVVVAQVAVVPTSLAYEASRTEYGARLRLTSLPARVRLDTPVPGVVEGGRPSLLRAIASWNARACASPMLVLTDEDDDVLIEIVPIEHDWKYGPVIAAHTAVESEPFHGNVRHVVIEIDARRPWSQDHQVSPDALDLESVLLHEIGHALGLDHSRNQDAVMRAGIKLGQTRRVLHDDDIAGVCSVTEIMFTGKSKSLADIGRILWIYKWLVWMGVFFVAGASVIANALRKRILAMVALRGVS